MNRTFHFANTLNFPSSTNKRQICDENTTFSQQLVRPTLDRKLITVLYIQLRMHALLGNASSACDEDVVARSAHIFLTLQLHTRSVGNRNAAIAVFEKDGY